MKKNLFLMLVFVLGFVFFSSLVSAYPGCISVHALNYDAGATEDDGSCYGFSFNTVSGNDVVISHGWGAWPLDEGLHIPATFNEYNIVGVHNSAFDSDGFSGSLTFEDRPNFYIDNYAFRYNEFTGDVVIPKATSHGNMAFGYNNFTSFTIAPGNNMTEFSLNLFRGNKFVSLVIPEQIQSLDTAFQYNTLLEDVIFYNPDVAFSSFTTSMHNPFLGCGNLTRIISYRYKSDGVTDSAPYVYANTGIYESELYEWHNIEGCMDPSAENYNEFAVFDDDSCEYDYGFADGDGSAEAPFEISTCEQFQNIHSRIRVIGHYVIDIRGIVDYFVLVNDVDCSGSEFWEQGFVGIGSEVGYDTFFAGSLDGRGHTVSNVYLKSVPTIFYRMRGGEVKNIVFDNIVFDESNVTRFTYSPVFSDIWAYESDRMQYVTEGFSNSILISNVSLINTNITKTKSHSGSISDVGGLIGIAGGGNIVIEDVFVDVNLFVQPEHPEGSVWGVGLLAGSLMSGRHGIVTLDRIHTKGSVTGISNNFDGYNITAVGGLIGAGFGIKVNNSFSRANVTGNGEQVGGLIGSIGYERTNHSVNVFDINTEIRNSYATGEVISLDNNLYVDPFAGGEDKGPWAEGFPHPTVLEHNFFDSDKSGFNSGRAFGLTTAAMKTGKPFLDAGWDFENVWGMHPSVNDGYPNLQTTGVVVSPVAPPTSSRGGGGGWPEDEPETAVTMPVPSSGAPLLSLIGDGDIDSNVLFIGLVVVVLFVSYFVFRPKKSKRRLRR